MHASVSSPTKTPASAAHLSKLSTETARNRRISKLGPAGMGSTTDFFAETDRITWLPDPALQKGLRIGASTLLTNSPDYPSSVPSRQTAFANPFRTSPKESRKRGSASAAAAAAAVATKIKPNSSSSFIRSSIPKTCMLFFRQARQTRWCQKTIKTSCRYANQAQRTPSTQSMSPSAKNQTRVCPSALSQPCQQA